MMTQDPDAAHWDGKPPTIRTTMPPTNRHQQDVKYILEWCAKREGFEWTDSVHWVVGYWVTEVNYTPNAWFEGRGLTPDDAVHHLSQTLRLIDTMECYGRKPTGGKVNTKNLRTMVQDAKAEGKVHTSKGTS